MTEDKPVWNTTPLEVLLIFDRLPTKELWGNSRAYRWARSGAARTLRFETMVALNNYLKGRGWNTEGLPFQKAEAQVKLIVPDNRPRDPDNMMIALKPIWDELREGPYRILMGDDWQHLTILTPIVELRKGQQGIEITIKEKANG